MITQENEGGEKPHRAEAVEIEQQASDGG